MKQVEIEQKAELNKQKLVRNSFVGGFVMVLILSFVLYRRYEERKLANVKLEFQYEEINGQKKEIELNRDYIARQNEKITDSINYAKRIQEAILPPMESIKKAFPDSLVLYKPKDIVSGDFYWFAKVEKDNSTYHIIAAVDCTGHGVPGAFMSMIGTELLNQIIIEKKMLEPAEILSRLHHDLRTALKQHDHDSESKDGMDISLCVFDVQKNILRFAGAYRPLYIIRNNTDTIEERKGDRFPVAGFHLAKERNFTNHHIDIQKGDCIYILSDGFVDQFGGANGKTKFTSKRFKQQMIVMKDKSMSEQQTLLENVFTEWKGLNTQLDDVIVVGIKV